MNALNVVSPPQKPVPTTATAVAPAPWNTRTPVTNPMAKEPTTFTVIVPSGSTPLVRSWTAPSTM